MWAVVLHFQQSRFAMDRTLESTTDGCSETGDTSLVVGRIVT